MTQRLVDGANVPSVATSSHANPYPTCLQPHANSPIKRESNVSQLLSWREVSPSVKRSARKLWGDAVRQEANCFRERCEITDAKKHLISWVEAESLKHLSAKYCPLVPPPRSTIAAAFSPDGKTLASTHGDHTVKIIDCQSGSCLKVLSGHRRTPWVVRFHPGHPEVLASGSLDHEVRLWDANSAECIGSRDFHRPIASIAFHAQGDLLAVASGHKLYIWQYNKKGESSPSIVLRTRRSLRAVHFHPHAAPFLLTAEVNELNTNGPDSQMTIAMSPGYLQYPPPAVLFANVNPGSAHNSDAAVTSRGPFLSFPYLLLPASFIRENLWISAHQDNMVIDSISRSLVGESSPHIQEDTNASENEHVGMPMDISSLVSSSTYQHERVSSHMSGAEGSCADSSANTNVTVDNVSSSATDMKVTVDNVSLFSMDTKVTVDNLSSSATDTKVTVDNLSSSATDTKITVDNMASSFMDTKVTVDKVSSSAIPQPSYLPDRESAEAATTNHPSSTPGSINLHLLLRRTAVAQLNQFLPLGDPSSWEIPFLQGWLMGQSHAGTHSESQNMEVPASLPVPRGVTRAHSRQRYRSRLIAHGSSGDIPVTSPNEEAIPQNSVGSLVPDLVAAPASLSAAASTAAAAELPCTVRLRLWPHDIKTPCAQLDQGSCRLSIPHAVLCSEMGAHFSPCGRFLAACVACVLPPSEQMHQDYGASTSPTRHPATAHHVVYELRIYSLENATFGEVLASRAIRAAHCLTSIQFSPSSEHILLAYGRRHNSLLRSIIVDGETTTPIYTILEVYKVLDMELVRVLPSAEDEVNVACFHPIPGSGIVYGTKEGKLRILQYDSSHNENCMDPGLSVDESILEVL